MVQLYQGYDFFFKIGDDVLTLPITPSELTIKSGSNNKVVTLIGGGDINILKAPSLMEIEFKARFPMRKYPYSRDYTGFYNYFEKFMKAKEERQAVRFSVVRSIASTDGRIGTWGTGYPDSLLVSIEELETNESVDEGDDVIVSFKLKKYKEYGVQVLPNSYVKKTTSTANQSRATDNKGETSSVYTVQQGDCMWNIAKAAYGNGSKETIIYNANKQVIEDTAKKHGFKSSRNGWWIFPGTKLTIPNISNASTLKVTKLK